MCIRDSTSIMGYAITDQPLGELEIRAYGFTDEELLDPAVALYAQLYLRTCLLYTSYKDPDAWRVFGALLTVNGYARRYKTR